MFEAGDIFLCKFAFRLSVSTSGVYIYVCAIAYATHTHTLISVDGKILAFTLVGKEKRKGEKNNSMERNIIFKNQKKAYMNADV